jgi:hypothetical protein
VIASNGVTLYMDLTREGFDEPIDAYGQAVILGLRPCCDECTTRDENRLRLGRVAHRDPDPRVRDRRR